MVPPTTPPNPTGEWMTIDLTNGSIDINDPPAPSSTLRNDSKERIPKESLFTAVPCTLTALYRGTKFSTINQAGNVYEQLQFWPNSPFPFTGTPTSIISEDMYYDSKNKLKGSIHAKSSGSDVFSRVRFELRYLFFHWGSSLRFARMHHGSSGRPSILGSHGEPRFLIVSDSLQHGRVQGHLRRVCRESRSVDERNLLLRPTNSMRVDQLMNRLDHFTANTNLQIDSIWLITTTATPNPNEKKQKKTPSYINLLARKSDDSKEPMGRSFGVYVCQ
jgi:hypothetical protein